MQQNRQRQVARRRLVDVQAAADYLNTSPRHIRRLVEEKRIPYLKLGPGRNTRLRFDLIALDDWLDQFAIEPSEGRV